MSRIKTLLFLLALAAQVPLASATVTYAVGSCEPRLPSFTTISAAVGASPAPSVVEVCPGNYPEQIVITTPMTVEGISNGTSAGATISVPSGGLVTTNGLAVQVSVENVSGKVNLSNLTVDGTGNNITGFTTIVGVFYQNSSGAVNHLTIQNQNGNGQGFGLWLQGGGSTEPSLTVENSNLQGFDGLGIFVETEVTATIKGNYLVCNFASCIAGIDIETATASISSNLIAGPVDNGITEYEGEGSISGNTIIGASYGMDVDESTSTVTSNTIYNTSTGMALVYAPGAVSGNTIVQSGTAIDLGCLDTDNSVRSNTILGATNGLVSVPSGAVTPETYYNVGTISTGGCT